MHISLIICTRNRVRQLVRCLEAVRRMAFEHEWELIIVDNGSSDETAAATRTFIRAAAFPARCVFEPEPGLGNAHNAGVAAASGEIVAFTDDDCYPAADFLSRVWSAFADPSVGYITGRILLHDPTDFPVTINESVVPISFRPRSFIGAGVVVGANMAFRRQVLLEIGGFDPWFGPGALFVAEDCDAATRASVKGWEGRYRPEVVVRHHHGRKASAVRPLLKSYGIGAGAFQMKVLFSGDGLPLLAAMIYKTGGQFVRDPRVFLWMVVGAAKYTYFRLRLLSAARAVPGCSRVSNICGLALGQRHHHRAGGVLEPDCSRAEASAGRHGTRAADSGDTER
jgi:glycosyltransferase involved in cell wall biosynthesis